MRISDWSSDVCSSDLFDRQVARIITHLRDLAWHEAGIDHRAIARVHRRIDRERKRFQRHQRAWNHEFLVAEDFVILLNEADILGAGDHPMNSVARRPHAVGPYTLSLPGMFDTAFLPPPPAPTR